VRPFAIVAAGFLLACGGDAATSGEQGGQGTSGSGGGSGLGGHGGSDGAMTSNAGGDRASSSSAASGGGGGSSCAPPEPCSNGVKDGWETDVDCGGSCQPCLVGSACLVPNDCATRLCAAGKCASLAASCSNGRRDGSESDVDCGGAACPACPDGKACAAPADCLGGYCVSQVCATFPSVDVYIAGSGQVTSNPAGISCPPTCSAAFGPTSPNVTLLPHRAAGWKFDSCQPESCTASSGPVIVWFDKPSAGFGQWTHQFAGGGDLYALASGADAANEPFVAGSFTGTADFGAGRVTISNSASQVFVTKFDTAGNVAWAKPFGGANDRASGDADLSLAIDPDGSATVVATLISASFDVGGKTLSCPVPTAVASHAGSARIAFRLDPNGNVSWAKCLSLVVSQAAVDPMTGDLIVTGPGSGVIDFGGATIDVGADLAVFVARYAAADGSYLDSAVPLRGVTLAASRAEPFLGVDEDGRIAVAASYGGHVQTSSGGFDAVGSTDIAIVALGSDLTTLWTSTLGGPSDDLATAVIFGPGGSVILGASFRDQITLDCGPVVATKDPWSTGDNGGINGLLVAFDGSTGAVTWRKRLGAPPTQLGSSSGDDFLVAVPADVDLGGGPIPAAPIVGRMHADGSYVWGKQMPTSAVTSMVIMSNGDSAILGSTKPPDDSSTSFEFVILGP
jgi:hypothetical protein